MTQSTKLIIELIQTALSGTSFMTVPTKGWRADGIDKLLDVVTGQGIAPLVCDAIRIVGQDKFDEDFVMGVIWHTMDYQNKSYAKMQGTMVKLSELFDKHGVPFMVVKGFDLGRYYPKPSLRYFSDIDFYNFGQFEKADALVASELGVEVHSDVHHHTTFELGGVHCENHFDFVNVHTHSENVEFERILKEKAEVGCRSVSLESLVGPVASGVDSKEDRGVQVLVPSPDFNALFVMRHMASHFAAEKILLRHLVDWALFVNAEGSRVDWEFVNSTFERFGMKAFVDAISGICMRWFGMDDVFALYGGTDGESFADGESEACKMSVAKKYSDEALEDRILEDIIVSTWNPEMPSGRLSILVWKIRRYFAAGWKRRLVYKSSGVEAFVRSVVAHMKKPASLWR